MTASLLPPRIDRPGVTYVVAAEGVDRALGPFKIGESEESVESRLWNSLTFQHPDVPLVPVEWHKCFDRAWVESFVHRELANYRCAPPALWRAKGKKPEWFRCSYDLVQQAFKKALKADKLHRQQAEEAVARSASTQAEPLTPATGQWLLDAVLGYRVKGKTELREMVAHALATEGGFAKFGGKLQEVGFKCLPLEGIVVLRTQSEAFDTFMRKLGVTDWKSPLKKTVAFDDAGNPLSAADLKQRCAGYDVTALLR